MIVVLLKYSELSSELFNIPSDRFVMADANAKPLWSCYIYAEE